MIDLKPCSVSRCSEPSVFSTLGLVGGAFESRCYPHALADAERQAADANRRLAALRDVRSEVPGQMELLG